MIHALRKQGPFRSNGTFSGAASATAWEEDMTMLFTGVARALRPGGNCT